MKLYTFLTEEGSIIEQVRAENHDIAVALAVTNGIEFGTDFYSENI